MKVSKQIKRFRQCIHARVLLGRTFFLDELYAESQAQKAMMESKMKELPPQMQSQMKSQLTAALEMLESGANYPDEAIAVYKKNQAKLDAAIKRLEDLDKD